MGSSVKGIAVLGSTGSVGRQALDVIRAFPDQFTAIGLGGWRNHRLLDEQVVEFQPALVSYDDTRDGAVSPRLAASKRVSMEEMVCDPRVDIVVMAVAGPAGLVSTLRALRVGKTVALASKEVLVMAGPILAREMAGGAALLPVDSEPSAIWQCLRGEDSAVERIIITASGGAFRKRSPDTLHSVTPQEALNHPTWTMGRKITVDSATLMNKAFEVIEAHWLFNMPWECIEVVIHPQSIVHSFVEFQDGSVKAQMAPPDMRLPLQYAMFYPKRVRSEWLERLDFARVGSLDFEPLDETWYPCFSMALDAAKKGGTYPAALCGADEAAVTLFLDGKIGFMDIPDLIRRVIEEHRSGDAMSLDDVIAAESWARRRAHELVPASQ